MPVIPGYPEYELRGRVGSRRIVHKGSDQVFGREKVKGHWENQDDEGGTITANSPEELLASNAAAAKAFDKSCGFTE